MPTRRTTLIGLGQLAVGAGTFASGAFGASASVSSDVRVVIVSDLSLTAGREADRYVETDADGLVTAITLDEENGLNTHARTRFEELVTLTNHGDQTVDELHFDFEVEDDDLGGGDPSPEEIEDALQIVSATGEIEATGADDFFVITDEDDLAPGESVPFGVQVDLQPESGPGSIGSLPDSDRFSVSLTITATMQ